jgi:raffinose/stachyose/melibiose transport system permease protein
MWRNDLNSPVVFKPTWKKLLLGLGPGVLIYAVIVIGPLIYAFIISLYSDVNYKFHWAGLLNYINLVQDPEFWMSFKNNLMIIGINGVLQIGFAFVLALLINSKLVVAKKFVRIFIFFPVILTPIVVANLWSLIYDYNQGMLNVVLTALHLQNLVQNWLVNPKIVMYAVIAPMTWQFLGLFVVIFLAGLTSIPQDLLEAAEMDGANGVQKTMQVIMPLMANTWKVILVLSTANGIKVFDQPFVMTGGGPGVASSVLSIFAYDQSFHRAKLAYGSSVAIGMVILTLILIGVVTYLFNLIFIKRRSSDY